jgi:hypothetical protein
VKYPIESDFTSEKVRTSLPKSSPLRRRLTSRLQPLHGGLGFGAGAIRERALVVARQASQRRASPNSGAAGLQNRPALGSSGAGLQFTEEKTVVREVESIPFVQEQDVPEKFAGKWQAMNEQVRRTAATQPDQSGRMIAQQAMVQTAGVPSIKSFLTSPRKLRPPSVMQSLLAWFFDTLLVLACLVVGFTISASVPFMSLLAHKFPTLIKYSANQAVHVGSFGWIVLMMQTLAVASLLFFFIQALAGVFFSASIGRAIANVQIASSRSALGRGFKIALGELLQWPLAFGLLNAIVSPEHNFFFRSVRWARGGSQD